MNDKQIFAVKFLFEMSSSGGLGTESETATFLEPNLGDLMQELLN